MNQIKRFWACGQASSPPRSWRSRNVPESGLTERNVMTEHKRLYLLISIMTGVSLLVGGITISVLYQAAMHEVRHRLMESAQSQARLIEAIARFDAVESADFPEGSSAATIKQVLDAHRNFKGAGETGEFTLARREGNADRISAQSSSL